MVQVKHFIATLVLLSFICGSTAADILIAPYGLEVADVPFQNQPKSLSRVVAVQELGPAWQAGLRPGDVLLTSSDKLVRQGNSVAARFDRMDQPHPVPYQKSSMVNPENPTHGRSSRVVLMVFPFEGGRWVTDVPRVAESSQSETEQDEQIAGAAGSVVTAKTQPENVLPEYYDDDSVRACGVTLREARKLKFHREALRTPTKTDALTDQFLSDAVIDTALQVGSDIQTVRFEDRDECFLYLASQRNRNKQGDFCDPSLNRGCTSNYRIVEARRSPLRDEWCRAPFVYASVQDTAVWSNKSYFDFDAVRFGPKSIRLVEQIRDVGAAFAAECEGAVVAVMDFYWSEFPYSLFTGIYYLNPIDRNAEPVVEACLDGKTWQSSCLTRRLGTNGAQEVAASFEEIRSRFEPIGNIAFAQTCEMVNLGSGIVNSRCQPVTLAGRHLRPSGCSFAHNTCWALDRHILDRYRLANSEFNEADKDEIALALLDETGVPRIGDSDTERVKNLWEAELRKPFASTGAPRRITDPQCIKRRWVKICPTWDREEEVAWDFDTCNMVIDRNGTSGNLCDPLMHLRWGAYNWGAIE